MAVDGVGYLRGWRGEGELYLGPLRPSINLIWRWPTVSANLTDQSGGPRGTN